MLFVFCFCFCFCVFFDFFPFSRCCCWGDGSGNIEWQGLLGEAASSEETDTEAEEAVFSVVAAAQATRGD